MSYTPPAGDEADLQFAGTYVPFAGDRADLTFEELAAGVTRAQGVSGPTHFGTPEVVYGASGWLATHFGTPVTKVVVYANGFTSTTFGAPRWGVVTQHTSPTPSTAFGTAAIEPHVMPIYSTVFGTPNSPYLQTGVATGFLTLQLGPDPRLVTVGYAISSPPSTVVSTAYTATAQTAEASGTAFTKFGTPFYGAPPEIIVNWRCVARGWETTNFGTPRAPHTVATQATGFRSTRWGWPKGFSLGAFSRLGTPHALRVQPTTGWTNTAFGTPHVVYVAAPIYGTAFGAPAAKEGHLVLPRAPRTRFGNPASFIGGHIAFGIQLGYFGQPSASNALNRGASGWTSTLHGSHTAWQNHKATHIPPPNKLGTPLLRRNTTC